MNALERGDPAGDTGRNGKLNDLLVIDCLQTSRPSRRRFLEWRAGDVGCVHVTLAIWKNARETLTAVSHWNRMFADHADLIASASASTRSGSARTSPPVILPTPSRGGGRDAGPGRVG